MYADAYRRGHQRIIEFIADRDTTVTVPATPAWTAGDVVRHLAGNSVDLVAGRIDGFASDEWTATQVLERRDRSVADVIEEWSVAIDEAAEGLDDITSLVSDDTVASALGALPPSALPPMAVSDILHHEFDLRNAYGDRSGRDILDVHGVAAGHVRALRRPFADAGLDTLRIESTDAGVGWNIGHAEPVATARASSFEIMRGIGGRRTVDELLAWKWAGDPHPIVRYLVLPHLRMRESTLREV